MEKLLFVAALCVLIIGFLSSTDASLQLDVSPASVAVNLTTSLVVNCSFSYTNYTQTNNLISLIVSKIENQNSSTPRTRELASINAFGINGVNIIDPALKASVNGLFDVAGVSFLSLQWTNPQVTEAGQYRCNALGLDSVGHSVDEKITAEVKFGKPDLGDLMKIIRDQQLQMDKISDLLKNLTSNMGDGNKLTPNNTVSDNVNGSVCSCQQILPKSFNRSEAYQGTHYLLSKEQPLGDRIAQAACRAQGGYLAEIDDAGEYAFVKTFINASTYEHTDWILVGGTDREQEGDWMFSHSQQAMSFTSWIPGYPYYKFPGCLFLFKRFDWGMLDEDCSLSGPTVSFLCEIPQS